MLPRLLHNVLYLRLAQAAVAAAFAVAVAFHARRRGVNLTGGVALALVRGLSQIVLAGMVLAVLLQWPWWTGPLMLVAMIGMAARTSSSRLKGFPMALRTSLLAVAGGAGTTILLMTLLGVIGRAAANLVPVGSMLIANAMNANALAMERLRRELESHTGEIETALSLGATPDAAVAPYLAGALRAGLIPSIDNLRSLGIVWIPGIMAGMVLAGVPPLDASIYQFVVLAAIFGSSGATCLFSTWMMCRHAFTAAGQLVPELLNPAG